MEECKKMKHCNEGLFVHAINAKRKGKYINNAIKFYRVHKNNWASGLSMGNLIVSQIIYTMKSIRLIITLKNLSFSKKIIFSIYKFYTSLKALIYFASYACWKFFGLDKILFLKKIFKNKK